MSMYNTITDKNGVECKLGDLVEPLISPYGVRRIVAIYDLQEYHNVVRKFVLVRKAELDHISYCEGKKVVPVRLSSTEFQKSKEKETQCQSYCFCQNSTVVPKVVGEEK
jgi:hypothetical protein